MYIFTRISKPQGIAPDYKDGSPLSQFMGTPAEERSNVYPKPYTLNPKPQTLNPKP